MENAFSQSSNKYPSQNSNSEIKFNFNNGSCNSYNPELAKSSSSYDKNFQIFESQPQQPTSNFHSFNGKQNLQYGSGQYDSTKMHYGSQQFLFSEKQNSRQGSGQYNLSEMQNPRQGSGQYNLSEMQNLRQGSGQYNLSKIQNVSPIFSNEETLQNVSPIYSDEKTFEELKRIELEKFFEKLLNLANRNDFKCYLYPKFDLAYELFNNSQREEHNLHIVENAARTVNGPKLITFLKKINFTYSQKYLFFCAKQNFYLFNENGELFLVIWNNDNTCEFKALNKEHATEYINKMLKIKTRDTSELLGTNKIRKNKIQTIKINVCNSQGHKLFRIDYECREFKIEDLDNYFKIHHRDLQGKIIVTHCINGRIKYSFQLN